MSDESVSAEKPVLNSIHCWLDTKSSTTGDDASYRLIHITEKGNRKEILDELFQYIDHAYQGSRNRSRKPLGTSLHQFHKNTTHDPVYGYPHKMGDIALQGFF